MPPAGGPAGAPGGGGRRRRGPPGAAMRGVAGPGTQYRQIDLNPYQQPIRRA